MRHLNYNHLLYFWTVIQEGSIAKAAEQLNLTPQTISGQLKVLEQYLGEPLFKRVGRRLVPNSTGEVVHQYADEIFTLGGELTQRVRSGQLGASLELNVGLVSSIAKLVAVRVLEPVLAMQPPIKVVCVEAPLESLLADLAVHRLDLILSDKPVPKDMRVKAFTHDLGHSPVAFFAQPEAAKRLAANFPFSLNEEPVLMPVPANSTRRLLDDWFERTGVIPRIVAEFNDSALLKAFGETGIGAFPAPSAIASRVTKMYGVEPFGVAEDVVEGYFAISPERKLKHPAALQVIETARATLFS